MRTEISVVSASRAQIIAAAACPGMAIYGNGRDGALSLGSNTEIADSSPIVKQYTTGDLNGYYLSGTNFDEKYITLFFSGQLDLDGGSIISAGDSNSSGAGGASVSGSGAGGRAGNVTDPHGEHGRCALWIFARAIIGTGTFSSDGGDGTDGSNGAAATGTANGNAGSLAASGVVTASRGSLYGGTAPTGGGGGQSAGAGGTAGVGSIGPEAASVDFIMDMKHLGPATLFFNATSQGTASESNQCFTVTPNGSGGGSGGANNGGAQGGGGGGGGAGGAVRSATGGGAGATGAAGTAGASGTGGGGGGGGLPAGFVFVLTESAPSTLTVSAIGGDGGDGGDPDGNGGHGGGGGGGEGGIALLVAQDGHGATVTAAGGAIGAGGAGAVAGGAGWAMDIPKDSTL